MVGCNSIQEGIQRDGVACHQEYVEEAAQKDRQRERIDSCSRRRTCPEGSGDISEAEGSLDGVREVVGHVVRVVVVLVVPYYRMARGLLSPSKYCYCYPKIEAMKAEDAFRLFRQLWIA